MFLRHATSSTLKVRVILRKRRRPLSIRTAKSATFEALSNLVIARAGLPPETPLTFLCGDTRTPYRGSDTLAAAGVQRHAVLHALDAADAATEELRVLDEDIAAVAVLATDAQLRMVRMRGGVGTACAIRARVSPLVEELQRRLDAVQVLEARKGAARARLAYSEERLARLGAIDPRTGRPRCNVSIGVP